MSDRWFDPAWWFRLRCKCIAEADTNVPGFCSIYLCRRWRWHGGECRV